MTPPAKTYHQKAIEKVLLLVVGAQRGALQCVAVGGPNPGFVVGLQTPESFVPLARIPTQQEIDVDVAHIDHPLSFDQDAMQETVNDLAKIPDLGAVVDFLNALETRLTIEDGNDFEALLQGGA